MKPLIEVEVEVIEVPHALVEERGPSGNVWWEIETSAHTRLRIVDPPAASWSEAEL